jgi:hypothetical protein
MEAAVSIEFGLRMSAKEEYNDRFNKKFDVIFDLIDVPNCSLFQIIERVKNLSFNVDPDLVQIVIQKKLDAVFAVPECSGCGKRLRIRYRQKKKVVTTVGTLEFDCPYFACPKCGSFHMPYEDALNLRPGQYQHDVQKVAALFSSKDTYEESADLLNEVYRFNISTDTVHKLADDVAGEVELTEIIPTSDEVSRIVEEMSAGRHRRPVFVFAADGAMAPVRTEEKGKPNCWKEVKGVRGYLLDSEHRVHLLSWHQISNKEQFLLYLSEIKEKGVIPEDKVRLCFIGDGGGWIWNTVREVYPDCREVLDYFHCSQHLYDFAKLHYGSGAAGRDWVENTKVRLFADKVSAVISGLKRMQCRTDEARDSCRKLIDYLTEHRGRVDYGKVRRGGYPLGSGAIESANKFICHVRLKRSGAWWKIKNANNVLKLRCAKYNGKFDSMFEEYEAGKAVKLSQLGVKLRKIK